MKDLFALGAYAPPFLIFFILLPIQALGYVSLLPYFIKVFLKSIKTPQTTYLKVIKFLFYVVMLPLFVAAIPVLIVVLTVIATNLYYA